MASGSTRRSALNEEIMWGVVAVPTSATALSSSTTMVFQIAIHNPTAGAITFAMTDNDTVPLSIVSISVPANQMYSFNYEDGCVYIGGVKWSAGSAGLVGEIVGYAKSSGA